MTSGPGGNAQETSTALRARQLAAELPEPHRSEVQRPGVEGLEVERVPDLLSGSLASLQPHALADLVADGLPRPTEIPVDLAPHEVLGHLAAALDCERERELGGPRLAGVVALVGRYRKLEVQPDVDDDAHRAQRLCPQHAELVCRVVEVAELAHEPLGVERPPFGVTRPAGQRALEAAQLAGQVPALGDREMMTGDALVVAERDLAP